MKYQEFSICVGKYLPPFHEIFCTENPYPEMFLTRTLFYLSTDFQNFCCTFCDKRNAQLCQENISSKFKQLQNICDKPLSDNSKQTLVCSCFGWLLYCSISALFT